jgi:hypothetical protein
MGNHGKPAERQRARELRARSWTLRAIADELGVAKGTASVWVRDVDFVPRPRNRGHPAGPKHPMRLKKEAEIAQCRVEADSWLGEVSDRDLALFALALYAGEGSKADGSVVFANSDPVLIKVFVTWLRRHFELDETRFRVKIYLHADLDLDAAVDFWISVIGVPRSQFNKPYRAAVDETKRTNRHVNGCASIVYHSRYIHRSVMAMIATIGSAVADPG